MMEEVRQFYLLHHKSIDSVPVLFHNECCCKWGGNTTDNTNPPGRRSLDRESVIYKNLGEEVLSFFPDIALGASYSFG